NRWPIRDEGKQHNARKAKPYRQRDAPKCADARGKGKRLDLLNSHGVALLQHEALQDTALLLNDPAANHRLLPQLHSRSMIVWRQEHFDFSRSSLRLTSCGDSGTLYAHC